MSLEDLMPLSHSCAMREVIGKTRYGSEIWIDFEPDAIGQFRFQVAKFESEDERYDTLCVLETYSLRLVAQRQSFPMTHLPLLCVQIDEWLEVQVSLNIGTAALALHHHVSTDRLRYGLSLIHPAYRW